LRIIEYPHPTLRHVSRPVKRVDTELRRIVDEMTELMYEAKGVGLAANQVDLPLRLFVMNLEGERSARQEQRVLINPVITRPKGQAEAEEGCLSLPGLYSQVARPQRVTIHAFDLSGNELRQEVEGMFARVVQHETDHLDGVLFIDRLSPTRRLAVREATEEFERNFAGRQQRGEVPDDKAVAARLAEWQARYC
jgi:peptide deformylase